MWPCCFGLCRPLSLKGPTWLWNTWAKNTAKTEAPSLTYPLWQVGYIYCIYSTAADNIFYGSTWLLSHGFYFTDMKIFLTRRKNTPKYWQIKRLLFYFLLIIFSKCRGTKWQKYVIWQCSNVKVSWRKIIYRWKHVMQHVWVTFSLFGLNHLILISCFNLWWW